MKKIFILLLLVLSCQSSQAQIQFHTYSPMYNSYGYHPYSSNRYAYRNYPVSAYNKGYNCPNFSDMSALEKYALERTYQRENNITRLQRLEMQAFGAIQEGDINSRYENVRSAILSRPKTNYKTSLLRGIGNYFAGQLTGYTPELDSYSLQNSTISPSFGQSYENRYYTPWGKGYQTQKYGTGSSSSIRILD